MKNSSETLGNRIRDLPFCCAVNTPPPPPACLIFLRTYRIYFNETLQH
jgi:hypothetical protein